MGIWKHLATASHQLLTDAGVPDEGDLPHRVDLVIADRNEARMEAARLRSIGSNAKFAPGSTVGDCHRLLDSAGAKTGPNQPLVARLEQLIEERDRARACATVGPDENSSIWTTVHRCHRLLDAAGFAITWPSPSLVARLEHLIELHDNACRAAEQRADPTIEEAHRLLDSTGVEAGTLAGRIEELMGRSDDALAAYRETSEALDRVSVWSGSLRERVELLIEARRTARARLLGVEKANHQLRITLADQERAVTARQGELDQREEALTRRTHELAEGVAAHAERERRSEERDAKWHRELDLRRDELDRRESLLAAREAVVKGQLADQGTAVRAAMHNGQPLPETPQPIVDDPATWPFPGGALVPLEPVRMRVLAAVESAFNGIR